MSENVKKCVSMAMKRFSAVNAEVKRYGNTASVLLILNYPLVARRFVFVDVAGDRETLAYDHFKELGRWISVDLKEDKVKTVLQKRVVSDLATVDSSGLNGFCKLFIYEFFLVRRVSWHFLVHDLCLTFAALGRAFSEC